MLIERGAGRVRVMPLHMASQNELVEVASLLIGRGMDVVAQNGRWERDLLYRDHLVDFDQVFLRDTWVRVEYVAVDLSAFFYVNFSASFFLQLYLH
jgi:hypothetical protein